MPPPAPRSPLAAKMHKKKTGGEGGIRTPETLARLTVFKTAAFDHSATSPSKTYRSSWLAQLAASRRTHSIMTAEKSLGKSGRPPADDLSILLSWVGRDRQARRRAITSPGRT